jgi:predicted nucleic acid-binding protein
MSVAVLDTNVLFARASERDDHHDTATDIITGIDHGGLPDALVTNYIMAEVLNLTREKLGPEAGNDMLDRLIEASHFDILHAPETDFISAQAIYQKYPKLSFVDATIVARMQHAEIEYLYSFDDDFDAVDDITRLDTPDNPFRSSVDWRN